MKLKNSLGMVFAMMAGGVAMSGPVVGIERNQLTVGGWVVSPIKFRDNPSGRMVLNPRYPEYTGHEPLRHGKFYITGALAPKDRLVHGGDVINLGEPVHIDPDIFHQYYYEHLRLNGTPQEWFPHILNAEKVMKPLLPKEGYLTQLQRMSIVPERKRTW